MSKQIEALKLALDALEAHADIGIKSDKAITAIREALAERFCDNNCTWLDHHPECDKAEQPAQQEPAGSIYRYGKDSSGKQWHGIRWTASGLDLPDGTLIYTSPQPSKPWVGLTEFDIDQIPYSCSHADSRLIAYAIEAKLKGKNA